MICSYNKEDNCKINYLTDCPRDCGIVFRDIGRHKPKAGHIYGPAVRDYYLIHVVVSGKGWFMKDGKTTPLSAGDCFIIRPDEVTTYGVNDDDPWEYYWLSFYGEAAKNLASYAFTDDVSTAKAGNMAIKLITAMFKSVDSDPEMGALDVISRLYQFLAELKRNICPEAEQKSDYVVEAVHYIETNYFQKINVADLAESIGVTRSHFTSVFKDKTGKSPYNYLLDYRLDKAMELLKEDRLSVSEVAYSVGFSGIERFSDMFKKRFGENPTAFRRNFQKNANYFTQNH